MLRISLVSQFFPPELNAPANRVGVLARRLATATHLEVVAPLPSYPDKTVFEGVDVDGLDRDGGITIHRSSAFRAHGGTLTRGLREIGLARTLLRGAVESDPDVVWVSVPSMFLVPTAVRAGRRSGAAVVVDVRDLTWTYALDSPVVTGWFRQRVAKLVAMWIDRALARADLILVTNEGARTALLAAGIAPAGIVTLPNGIDRARFNELSLLQRPPAESSSELTVGYCGLVGHNQGLGTLLDVASRLPQTHFVVAGDGPELRALREAASRRGLSNIELKGQVDWDGVVDLYRRSDVLFAQVRSRPSLTQTAVPSKVYEYMSAGRPVVYGGMGIAADLVSSAGAGIVVPAEDAGAIADAITTLGGNTTLRNEMGQRGRIRAAESVREDIADRLVPVVLERLAHLARPATRSR